MNIRLMKVADYKKVYQLWMNTPGMGLNDIDDSQEGIEKYIKRNPATCFVAEEDNEIIGVIISGHDGRRGYIYHTAVDKTHRKRGIGQQLVDCALKALDNEGINKVALVAFSHNELGNHFWEKCGFEKREDLIYRNKSIHMLKRIDT